MKNVPDPFDPANFINSDSGSIGEFAVWNENRTFGNHLEDKVFLIKSSYMDIEKGKRFYGGDILDFVETKGVKFFPLRSMGDVEDISEDEIMLGAEYLALVGKK